MEPADIVAGGAEEERGLRLVQAEQVDHRMLDLGRGHGHRLIGDVAMAAILADRGDAQRVLLVAPGQSDDRAGHGRREKQGPALLRRRVEDLLEILAKAHVEHLVRLVEHGDAELGEIERAPFEMVAKPARRADDDVGAAGQVATLLRRIHPADAGRDPRAGLAIEPDELAADLQRQLAGRRDHQGDRLQRIGEGAAGLEQLRGDGEAEGDGLARAGLGRDDEVAALGLGLEDGGLDGRGRRIAARGERFAEKRRQIFECHIKSRWGARSARQGHGAKEPARRPTH